MLGFLCVWSCFFFLFFFGGGGGSDFVLGDCRAGGRVDPNCPQVTLFLEMGGGGRP